MGKFLIYELKDSYKFVLFLLLAVFLSIITLFSVGMATTELYPQMSSVHSSAQYDAGSILMAISMLILFSSGIAFLIYSLSSFRRELYEDKGYLTFTLPLNGYQILGAKLAAALFWSALLGGVLIGTSFLGLFFVMDNPASFGILLKYIGKFLTENKLFLPFVGICWLLAILALFLPFYFCIGISKIVVRNRRIGGGLWFTLYILLSFVLIIVMMGISVWLPYYLGFSNGSIVTAGQLMDIARSSVFYSPAMNYQFISASFGFPFGVHLVLLLFVMAISVALFVMTGWILDKKVEIG